MLWNKPRSISYGPHRRSVLASVLPACSKTPGKTKRWRGHRHSVLFSGLRSVSADRARSNMLEELLNYTALALAFRSKTKKKRTRSKWAKAWLLKRNNLSHINLLKDLTLEPGDWYNYLRMDSETYLQLFHLVAPHIRENDSLGSSWSVKSKRSS
jgi:hypothetical protein